MPQFIEQFQSAISGGPISMFQLRLKDCDDKEIIKAGKAFLPICHDHNIKLIINDSLQLTEDIGADGTHLGEDDSRAVPANKDKILGVSCYNSLDAARQAAETGAGYVSFGAFYPTKTKLPKSKAEVQTIIDWKKNNTIPCSAIGGITPQNAPPLIAAGADYICTVSYVWDHPISPARAVNEFTKILG